MLRGTTLSARDAARRILADDFRSQIAGVEAAGYQGAVPQTRHELTRRQTRAGPAPGRGPLPIEPQQQRPQPSTGPAPERKPNP
ncbi:hypothetical protein JCM9957A_57980 [Kineosporia succinea]